MVILCDKEVAILIGPTLAINLKVDWSPTLTMGRHRLIDTGRAVGQTNLSHMRFRCGALPVKVNLIN